MASSPKEYFENDVAGRLRERPELAQRINAVYQFEIAGESGGNWIVDLTRSEVREGTDEAARCTVSILDVDFMEMVGGNLNPQMAFMSGKLKVGGDMSLAMKLTEIIQ
ncbi:MAG: SCP2 sterol-binding domain-containing protein [Myxococcota bacterium]